MHLLNHSFTTRLAVVVMAVLLCGDLASGGTIRHDVSDNNYTSLAHDNAFSAVGRLTWSGGTGSGTLINSEWVLTAAHVADDMLLYPTND